MDKKTTLEILRQHLENEEKTQDNQIVNNYGIVINNSGNSNIYNNVDNNKNLTEDNKREVHSLIDKMERENKFKSGQSANDTNFDSKA